MTDGLDTSNLFNKNNHDLIDKLYFFQLLVKIWKGDAQL